MTQLRGARPNRNVEIAIETAQQSQEAQAREAAADASGQMPRAAVAFNNTVDDMESRAFSPPKSLVPHLVGTNGLLPTTTTTAAAAAATTMSGSDSEVGAKVKATFSQVEDDIAQLDARISQLSVVLGNLVDKRGKLQEYLEQHRALFSPARRVPPEIWGEIFLYCLSLSDADMMTEEEGEDHLGYGNRPTVNNNWFSSSSSDEGDAVNEDRDTRVPWVFTRVSRDWRVAAMSCPRLWTRVSMCVDDHTALSRRKLWPLARMLRLSWGLPLSVTLFGRSYDDAVFDLWTQSPMAQCLVATCQRWEKLRLSHIPCPRPNQFYSALRNRLDGLKVLEMHFSSELSPTRPFAVDVFSNAPKLRSLTMTGAFPYGALGLPMEQVTSCSMHGVSDFPWIIRGCPELVDLNLTLPLRIEPFSTSSDKLKSDRIRTLRLDLHTADHALTTQLLTSLGFPSLLSLHLECSHLPDGETIEFFKKSKSITHLTFRVEKWSEDSFLQSLRLLSSLERLCVSIWPRSIHDTEGLLNNLGRRRQSPDVPHRGPVLPKLTELELVSHTADFPVESFARLVRARWSFGRQEHELEAGMWQAMHMTPLTSVRVFLHGSNLADHVSATLARLSDLRDAGLNICAYSRGLLTSGVGRRIF